MNDIATPRPVSATTTARKLILPVAAVVVIALGAVIALVWATARGQDAIAFESSQTVVRSVFCEISESLGRIVFDYSWWDASVENLVDAPDPVWADDNVGSYIAETFEVAESFVVSADDRTTFAFAGEAVQDGADAFNFLGASLAGFVERARAAPMAQPVPVTGFLLRNGIVHLVAASAITLEHPEGEALEPRRRAVLVYTRHVDDALLARVSQNLGMPGLAISTAPLAQDDPRAALALTGPDGEPAAWLIWRAATPGTDLFLDILPWLAIGSFVFLGLLVVFYQRVRAAAARMEADARELAERERQLAHTSKLAVLGEMAAGIVHELNQPLNIIRMAADSMRSGRVRANADEMAEQFSLIAGQSMRMAEIMQNMRLFSRDDFGRKHAFDPREAVEQALSWLRGELAEKGIELVFDMRDSSGRVFGEMARFEQVVVNLVVNARDAILRKAADGADAKVVGRIAVRVADDVGADKVVVMVSDTGGGVPEAIIDRVFEPFFTTKEQGEGTGLGLSISYGIVAGMDGTLTVRNAETGAVFTVTLPRLAPAEQRDTRELDKAAQ